ncbi:MAG: hypothetical protein QW097_02595 [archaeon]
MKGQTSFEYLLGLVVLFMFSIVIFALVSQIVSLSQAGATILDSFKNQIMNLVV